MMKKLTVIGEDKYIDALYRIVSIFVDNGEFKIYRIEREKVNKNEKRIVGEDGR